MSETRTAEQHADALLKLIIEPQPALMDRALSNLQSGQQAGAFISDLRDCLIAMYEKPRSH
jgi:hypothetical protein